MPSGNSVRPNKWSNVIDLYDNGEYSAIFGNYDNSPDNDTYDHKCTCGNTLFTETDRKGYNVK